MHRRSRRGGLGDGDRDRRLDWLRGACQDRGETPDQQQEQAAPQHQPTGAPAYTPGVRGPVGPLVASQKIDHAGEGTPAKSF